MKIKQSETFCVDMTYVELRAIYKLIAHTSTKERMEKMKLTDDEDKASSRMFDVIHNFLKLDD